MVPACAPVDGRRKHVCLRVRVLAMIIEKLFNIFFSYFPPYDYTGEKEIAFSNLFLIMHVSSLRPG